VLVPLDLLNVGGRSMGRVAEDVGVRRLTRGELSAQRDLDTCVTSGTQTHASDGMATLLVARTERAKELSRRPEIDIRFIAKAEVRAEPSLMPEAPALAVRDLLRRNRAHHGRRRRGEESQSVRGERRRVHEGAGLRLAEAQHQPAARSWWAIRRARRSRVC